MGVEEKLLVKHKKYELVPPDGGYGYFIFVATIINFSTTTSFAGCFGLLFNDFMKEIGMSSTAVTLLTGISGLCFALSGFFTSALLKLMSTRKLALIAALIFDLGVLGIVFAKSMLLFFICQGIMQGVGIGILYNLSCTIINDYFLTKRLFAVSFIQTITGVVAMLAPIFVKWSLDEYGFRGTFLLITGISLQNLIAVALMQPVKWHMKKIEVETTIESELLVEAKMEVSTSAIPTVKLTDVEKAAKSSTEKVYELPPDPNKNMGLKKIVESIFDVPVCKQILSSCVSIGPALCAFADLTYTTILPQALYSVGWNENNVALALAVFAFGDLATRTLLIFGSKWLFKIGSQEMYVIGLVVAFFSRIGMLCSSGIAAVLFYISLMGAAHCTISVLITLVVSDVVSSDKFTSAMGVLLLLSGVLNIVLGPAIGAVRDLTNSYSAAFYLLTSCYAIVILFWSIELCYKKNKHRRVQREITKKSNQSIKK